MTKPTKKPKRAHLAFVNSQLERALLEDMRAHLERIVRRCDKQDEQLERMISIHFLMLKRIERYGQKITEISIRRELKTPTLGQGV
jgi:hypothetical protein